ncbi:hypothetical protein [Nonomuraea sp. NPDC049709]|uniref:hypothetical protein n=1 Tax=Nonomuraea sp. NPDC049709 TaxID=3154736 RepID=UPI00342B5933
MAGVVHTDVPDVGLLEDGCPQLPVLGALDRVLFSCSASWTSTCPPLIRDNHSVRLLLKSALAGFGVAFLLLLLLHWPTRDSDSELKLAMAFALAPFPLSMVAALLARLPAWPAVGLVAPFAMSAIVFIQPDYDSWVSDEKLAFYLLIAVPAVTGFMLTALLCALLFGKTVGSPRVDAA